MKKLIPLLMLIVMLTLTAGCDLAGINLTTTTQSAAINSFGASPPSIAAGESSTLSWSVSGASTVSIDQGIGNVALTGSRVVMPTATTVYTLTAMNAAGVSVTATAQVIVSGATPTPIPTPGGIPVINYFTASPSNIYAGNSSTLSWSVSNATSINIDHNVGTISPSGVTSVYPTTSTTYTLTVFNAAGATSQTATVFVSGAPAPTSFAVTSVTASVDPSFFSGTCPTIVNSYAVIMANGSGTVSYRWEDSDGGFEPTQNVYFSSAGSQTVSSSWLVDTSGSYWVRVHIFTPNEIISNQPSFTLNCASAPTGGWSGTWSTTYGMMHLTQIGNQVTGTYEHSNGHIVGTVSGNVLTGTWSEGPTYMPPDNAGDFQFTISSDGKTFSGGWRYGSSGSWTMNWNGTTIF